MPLASDRYVIEGRAGHRPAAVEVDEERATFRLADAKPEEAPLELRFSESFVFALRDDNRGSFFIAVGAILLVLATLWWINESAGPSSVAIAAAVGAALLVIGRATRRSILEVGDAEHRAVLVVTGKSRRIAREASEVLALRKPGEWRRPAQTVIAFLGRELSSLFASRVELIREYRALVGGDVDESQEARFPTARRKIAAWNLLWIFIVPAALGLAAFLASPSPRGGWALTLALVVFVVAGFVSMKLLKRLEPLLKRWIGD